MRAGFSGSGRLEGAGQVGGKGGLGGNAGERIGGRCLQACEVARARSQREVAYAPMVQEAIAVFVGGGFLRRRVAGALAASLRVVGRFGEGEASRLTGGGRFRERGQHETNRDQEMD